MFVILSNLVNENITFIFSFHISCHQTIQYNACFILKQIIWLIVHMASIFYKSLDPLIQEFGLKLSSSILGLRFLFNFGNK